MICRITRDRTKCRDCGECKKHWPGLPDYKEIDEEKMFNGRWNALEWAKNLCPRDAISFVWVRK